MEILTIGKPTEAQIKKKIEELRVAERELGTVNSKISSKESTMMQGDNPVYTFMGGWGLGGLRKKRRSLAKKVERLEKAVERHKKKLHL